MLICHIFGKHSVIDIKMVILVANKSPVQFMGRRIVLECFKLILNLPVNVLILSFCLSAFCFNHPDGTVFLLYDVVIVEEPLMPKRIQIYDREVLLTAVAVLVDPVYIVTTFAILLEQLLRHTADQRGGKSGSVFLISVAQIFDFFLHTRVVLEEVLIRNVKIRYLWFRHVHLNIALALLGRRFSEFFLEQMLIVDKEAGNKNTQIATPRYSVNILMLDRITN
jgi:hypothetical protein